MQNNKENYRYAGRLFRYMRPYLAKWSIGTLFYSGQSIIFVIIGAFFAQGIMSAIVHRSAADVFTVTVVYAVSTVTGMILVGVGAYLHTISYLRASRDLKFSLFRSYMKSDLESASSSHSGEKIAAINYDADVASLLYTNSLSELMRVLFMVAGSILAVFLIEWRLGVGAVIVGLIGFFMQRSFAKPLSKLGQEQLEVNSEAVKSISNIISGATIIRAFNMQSEALLHFNKDNGRLQGLVFKRAVIQFFQNAFTTVQGWLTIVLVFGLGGYFVALGQMELPMLMMAYSFCLSIAQVSELGALYANIQPSVEAAKRVITRIDNNNEKTQPEREREHESEHESRKSKALLDGYAIEINNMNFSYMGSDKPALRDVSLRIRENKMVALVGASGSGKSTLLRAVIGMYERDNMHMRIGSADYNKMPVMEWRSMFSYVDQSCKLFDMTIAENIAMGAGGEASMEEIITAAKRAYAHDFIEELEHGYETVCGEKGGALSGGQKQRIAIARALIKKAPIIVFDEATSALDSESESKIMDSIEHLRSDHTILITTHNLNNVTSADMIVVMENGSVVEAGTHGELLKKKGVYGKLYSPSGGRHD